MRFEQVHHRLREELGIAHDSQLGGTGLQRANRIARDWLFVTKLVCNTARPLDFRLPKGC